MITKKVRIAMRMHEHLGNLYFIEVFNITAGYHRYKLVIYLVDPYYLPTSGSP